MKKFSEATPFVGRHHKDISKLCELAWSLTARLKPSFATTNIEDRTWRPAEYCVDDRLVSNQPAAFDLSFAYRDGPR